MVGNIKSYIFVETKQKTMNQILKRAVKDNTKGKTVFLQQPTGYFIEVQKQALYRYVQHLPENTELTIHFEMWNKIQISLDEPKTNSI